jgi:hypothetical protein
MDKAQADVDIVETIDGVVVMDKKIDLIIQLSMLIIAGHMVPVDIQVLLTSHQLKGTIKMPLSS